MKLKVIKKQRGGRNNQGVIASYHRGGGNKKYYRIIDFKRSLFRVPGLVKRIEKDPNRNCNIALIAYKNGLLSYILAPNKLKVGDRINQFYDNSANSTTRQDNDNVLAAVQIDNSPKPYAPGNAMPLKWLPIGSFIHNIELKPGKGGQLMRSAGTFAKMLTKQFPKRPHQNKEGINGSRRSLAFQAISIIRLKSGRLYSISNEAMGTLGNVSSFSQNGVSGRRKLRKAGESRWRGRRPVVRGVAMNPVDHPHGGGEGKSKGGGHPVTPWGKLTKGKPTRYRGSKKKKLLV